MRLCRNVVALLAAVAVAAAPVLGVPRAVGVVLHADKARIGSGEALSGATVFSGDTLTTAAEGALRLRVAAALLYLLPNTALGLNEAQGWHVAQLHSGAVGFSTSGNERVAVRMDDVQIYPSSAQPTHAELKVVSPNELLLTSYRGPLEVMVGSEVHSVASPGAYRMLLEPAPEPQATQGAGRGGAKLPRVNGRRVLGIVLVTAAIGAGIAGIVLYNTREPASPFTPTIRPFPGFTGN